MCGKIWDLAELRQVRFSTDEDRGRALDDMRRVVDTGRADFQRDAEARFERTVYEHYRGAI